MSGRAVGGTTVLPARLGQRGHGLFILIVGLLEGDCLIAWRLHADVARPRVDLERANRLAELGSPSLQKSGRTFGDAVNEKSVATASVK